MKSSTERFLLFWQLCREYPKFVWMEGQMIIKIKKNLYHSPCILEVF